MKKEILIEGYSTAEILALPSDQIEMLVLSGEPLILRIGSAKILGEFKVVNQRLLIELAHIDGGGEGVLPQLWLLSKRYAQTRGLEEIEWVIHALNCANPNPKLRPFLEKRGFVVRELPGIGAAYHQIFDVKPSNLG